MQALALHVNRDTKFQGVYAKFKIVQIFLPFVENVHLAFAWNVNLGNIQIKMEVVRKVRASCVCNQQDPITLIARQAILDAHFTLNLRQTYFQGHNWISVYQAE